jgi:membrane protein YqaA with SNARE-associated domain
MAKNNLFFTFLIASFGNTIGSVITYEMGRIGNLDWLKKDKNNDPKVEKWAFKIQRFGSYLGLFAWLPFVGDIIVLAMGCFKTKRATSFLFFGIGKSLRYALLISVYYYFNQ